ncbi:Predicted oxidoreductase [Marinobacter gudaonensis]|uniref:Predicted oxidoreductase n=1 Tax=Marinobacter gudaonensis TaxID=375760 RepID=A0A1I6GIX3_9GAMM|nr:aldo/keto reductase [Marinobacter gudaonensis]SFR42173.1 Predicted oxidoreductase [Marinobacter gudaonensis]
MILLKADAKGLSPKRVVLGTALWGWGVDKAEAFQILDHFAESGGAVVDVATNYPINKVASDYGIALEYISGWIKSRRHKGLQVILKLGALDNQGSSQFDLSRDRIARLVNEADKKLGESLFCISVHWDNRGQSLEDYAGIEETAKELQELSTSGFEIGLSGIRNPAAYRKYLELSPSDLWIQVKENLLTHQARANYELVFPDAKYLAYGLNMGGLKIDEGWPESSKQLRNITHPAWLVDSVRRFLNENDLYPAVRTVSDLTLFHAFCNKNLGGVILGPRTRAQLKDALDFWGCLNKVMPMQSSHELESRVFGD